MDCSDAELLAGLSTERDMFAEFYRRHFDRVMAFAVRRVQRPEDAADLTQAIFLAVIESADRFDSRRGTPVGWLYGIAHNAVASWRRSQARSAEVHIRLTARRHLVPDEYAILDDRIAAARLGDEVAAAMAELPESQRLVLELVAHDGLTSSQAAEALGILPPTARMRLARARRAVRHSLSPPASSVASIPLVVKGDTRP